MDSYEEIKLVQKGMNWSYFYLKFRPRTKKEILIYLQKKSEKYSFTPEIIQKVLQELENQRLIDDKAFVELYVYSKSINKPKGETAFRNELQRLGVERDILDEYFAQNPINQEEQAHKALQRRWLRYSPLDQKKRFEKSAMFLASRGFSFDVIKKTIAQMEEKE